MKFEKQPMVGWFDFRQLLHTGIQTVVSSTFGSFADRREIQAALHTKNEFYDYSQLGNDVWIDYISDLGDGFNPTYTVAHVLAKEKLIVDGTTLERGKMLIMGGDEVYPTPELVEYNNRLKGPYKAAFPETELVPEGLVNPDDLKIKKSGDFPSPKPQPAVAPKDKFPQLFAIPGNHDWYDGLSNFIRIFTQQRRIGNWQTLQQRSYFAIKLPHNYWIWGIDVQLNSEIDQPQLKYFQEMAKTNMANGSQVILCTAEPTWVYKSMFKKSASFEKLDYFERNYIYNLGGKISTPAEPNKKHSLVATLTGDLHHYSRYADEKDGKEVNHRITAGGGGAFLHPTHNLPDELALPKSSPKLKAVFPSKAKSKKMLFGNLTFTFRSWQFSAFMGAFYILFSWIAQATTSITAIDDKVIKASDLLKRPIKDFVDMTVVYTKAENLGFIAWLKHVLGVWTLNPIVLLLLVGLFFGLYKFTDTNGSKTKYIGWAGVIHGLMQLAVLLLIIWSCIFLNEAYFFEYLQITDVQNNALIRTAVFLLEMFLVGGLFGSSLMGIYLLLTNLFFDIHLTESFSGLAIQNYKNILKLHFKDGKLTIYPIGIKEVTKNWKNVGTEELPRFEGTEPEIHLIEKPIVIY